MSPRSFWIVLLKLVGVWILFHAFDVVPQFFLLFYPASPSPFRYENWEVVLSSLIILLVYVAIIRLLIFRPDVIIDKLKLDERFDEEQFSFNIHRSTVIAIAVIIVGSLMIMNSVPVFLRGVYFYYRSQTIDRMGPGADPTSTFVDLCKILIGYLLVVNNRAVVNFIEKTRRMPVEVAYQEATEHEEIDNEVNPKL
ncbi:hypothetical protein IDJ77_08870 [Mucilaginibacter sp. ZT4R22]|uniref:Uncharacterized protein n=1 Tax=Mucilaginibacter pankratovii TaxID=2772110 RepID=A0ABR7WP27_9SPHI|nr:hypothetical protein [Mucilaginibacter pankratovii]MBD1363918.1 hypothetical protein [Mucilaginibacter pankratovii]